MWTFHFPLLLFSCDGDGSWCVICHITLHQHKRYDSHSVSLSLVCWCECETMSQSPPYSSLLVSVFFLSYWRRLTLKLRFLFGPRTFRNFLPQPTLHQQWSRIWRILKFVIFCFYIFFVSTSLSSTIIRSPWIVSWHTHRFVFVIINFLLLYFLLLLLLVLLLCYDFTNHFYSV